MFFSENFLSGLETKSSGFQNEFYGITERFYRFFEYDEAKIKEFDTYIEGQFSYYGKGNQLYYVEEGIGGKIDCTRKEEYFVELLNIFKELFLYSEDTGINTATNIIMAVNLPENISTDTITLIEMTIQTLKPNLPPALKVYVKHDNNDCFNCFIAVMK